MKLVEWNEGFARTAARGTCIEVRRDREVTYAATLCGKRVLFPGPPRTGVPSCADCLAKKTKRRGK